MSKKSVVMTAVIVGFSIVFALMITWMLGGGGEKAVIQPVPDPPAKQGDPAVVAQDDVQRAIEKDRVIAAEEGRYIGAITPEQSKAMEKEQEKQKIEQLKGELVQGTQPTGADWQGGGLHNQGADANQLVAVAVAQTPEEIRRKQLWKMFYARNADTGGVVSLKEIAPQDKEQSGKETQESQVGAEKATMPAIEYFKPYMATIKVSATSSKAGLTIPFVAEITQQSPIRGWRVIGQLVPDYKIHRFVVSITSIVSPDNKKFPIQGIAMSMDKSVGVVTKVRRDDIAGIGTVAGLAVAEAGIEALSKDQQMMSVSPMVGTVVTQAKAPDRVREAIIAGASAGFGETKGLVKETVEREPMLILTQGTQVLIYFTM
jgi:hypothetical protein